MEEILDQVFNENEKDETRINRVIAIIRVNVSALFLFIILRLWYFHWNSFDIDTQDSIGLIMSVVMLGMVVYNIKQIIVEWKSSFVYPQFSRAFTAVFILLNLFFIIGLFASLYVDFSPQKQSLSAKNTLQLIPLICLPLIIVREITYFVRATRLKRLKNQ